jgi:hypothetical protein
MTDKTVRRLCAIGLIIILIGFAYIADNQKQTISQQQVTITGLESALEANKYHLQECLKDARVGYSEFTGE